MSPRILGKAFKNYEYGYGCELSDIESEGVVLKHKKSGARIALISNDDDNKVFFIGFRTTPFDSTGVAHIIEHTVLCGSKKYPLKDPFVELAKSSLNTFLNAMTYPDKTIYPVASCNETDIKNLMSVYMDAVFFPNIYKYEEIFKQEGWHYELETPEDSVKINGVVYNEMKGVFSSPEDALEEEIMHELYPDTTYGYCSGGAPEDIPTLTYDNYLDFHRRYYHPANSYIYLYGNFDMEERLAWLDENYLSLFDEEKPDSEVPVQPVFKEGKNVTATYPVGDDEDTAEKTYLSLNYMLGDITNPEKTIAWLALSTVLFEIQGSPVRQALIDTGIGKDVLSAYNAYIRQPYLSITAVNTEAERADEFVSIIKKTLREQAEGGLDKKSLLAAINSAEFAYLEADTGRLPRGLVTGINMLNSWLYDDGMVFDYCKQKEIYHKLRDLIETDYFENLIKEDLLGNAHEVALVFKPEQGLTTRREEALAKELENYKAGLSDEEIKKLVEETAALREYQEAEDSPEAIASLPVLKVSDVTKEAVKLVNEKRGLAGTDIIFHDIATNSIAYAALYFNLPEFPEYMLPYVSILSYALGSLNTENYSFFDLTNEIGIYAGGYEIAISKCAVLKGTDEYKSWLAVKFKTFPENIGKCFELMLEILNSSDIRDKKRLKELLGEIYTGKKMGLVGSGHNTALERAFSAFSKAARFDQLTDGIAYYEKVKSLYENFDDCADDIIARLEYILRTVVRKDNLFVSLTCRQAEYDVFAEHFPMFKEAIKEENLPEPPALESDFAPGSKEAYKISGQIQYNALAGNFKKAGVTLTGAAEVMKTILSYEYLWMNVRVKGGAYGCFFRYGAGTGNCGFVSYRDPKLKETYDVYNGAADFIRNLELTQEQVDKYIIGTLSTIDAPRLPGAMGTYSLQMLLSGADDKYLQKQRDEILGATNETIRETAGLLDAASLSFCTVGSAGKCEENKEMFDSIKELE